MMRRRVYGPGEPRNPKPPTRIRHSASMPSACQKPSAGQPNSGGSSQFHSVRTRSVPRVTNTAIPTIAIGAMTSSLCPLLNPASMSSSFRQFVVDVLQPLAQVEHRVALPREQRIDVHTGGGGDLLEAASLPLVRDEHRALLLGQ